MNGKDICNLRREVATRSDILYLLQENFVSIVSIREKSGKFERNRNYDAFFRLDSIIK